MTRASALKTFGSFIFGSLYRYSPVSDLYAFGRKQDAAFQITRDDIHQRNHLRLWLTPLRFQGRPGWIGGISREIGRKFVKMYVNEDTVDMGEPGIAALRHLYGRAVEKALLDRVPELDLV